MIKLSHLRAVTRIPDPIHGNIEFNVFETEVIDSSYFQRLHYVLQNSTTYVAYPANKNTRFVHSLGTAFVSGELLGSALSHASTEDLSDFLEDIGTIFREYFFSPTRTVRQNEITQKLMISGWNKTIRGRSKFTHQPFIKQDQALLESDKEFGCDENGKLGFSAAFIVDTLWVSSRICGLVHDIGHLPMSHSFEGALNAAPLLFSLHKSGEDRKQLFTNVSSREICNKDQSTDEKIIGRFLGVTKTYFGVSNERVTNFINSIEVHERRSLAIFNLLANADNLDDTEFQEYRHVIYSMSFFTLFASIIDKRERQGGEDSSSIEFKGTSNAFRLLKGVFAGEVDADRMDYTLRDGVSCSSPIGNFDLSRVLSNAVLIKHRELDHYSIAYDDRALSGIERFFSERFNGYKYLIYHRTSSRTEACLQELIARLIHYSFVNPLSIITATLVKFRFVYREENGDITDIIPMTKSTLENFDDSALRSAFFEIRREVKPLLESDTDLTLENLDLLKPIGCLIDVVLLRDFSNIYDPFKECTFHSYMKDLLGDKYDSRKFMRVVSALLDKVTGEIYTRILKEKFQTKFKGRFSTIVQFQLPKIYDFVKTNKYDKVYLIDKESNLELLENKSVEIRNLRSRKKRDVDIKIYFLSKELKISDNDIEDIETHLKLVLLNLYEMILSNEAAIK